MLFTPGWAIGWYFVPLANLWKPYEAMKEIWQASSDPHSWQDQTVPSLLPWWWFFWVVSGMLGNVAFRLTMNAEEIDAFIVASMVTQLSDITAISLSFILIAIISRVQQMQLSHAEAGHRR